MGEGREVLDFELELKVFGLHAWEVEGVAAQIEHHVHDYSARPNID